jgi:hypothetical protein
MATDQPCPDPACPHRYQTARGIARHVRREHVGLDERERVELEDLEAFLEGQR